jgi:hypothetical protein
MSGLLKHSITTGKISQWRTHQSNFHASPDGIITPGCINISPAWFNKAERCVQSMCIEISGWLKYCRNMASQIISTSCMPLRIPHELGIRVSSSIVNVFCFHTISGTALSQEQVNMMLTIFSSHPDDSQKVMVHTAKYHMSY